MRHRTTTGRTEVGEGERKHTIIVRANPFSFALFFSPGFFFSVTMPLVPVGGRHIATYAICSTASGASVCRSAGTGSATIALNLKAYNEVTRTGCTCV